MQLSTPIQVGVFGVIFIALLIGVIIMLAPYWGMLFLALIFSSMTYPLFNYLQKKYGDKPKRHTAIVFSGLILIVIIPASIVFFWNSFRD